jgi:hypothetical protein
LMKDTDVPASILDTDDVDPKIDIRYTNGHVKGRFNLRFKQHIFNWVIATMVSGCGVHGVYLHYHEQDLENTIIEQQKMVAKAQSEASVAVANLQQLQLLVTQRSMPFLPITVGSQDSSKPKQ